MSVKKFFFNCTMPLFSAILFFFIKLFNIRILSNHMIGAVGHTILELDNFFIKTNFFYKKKYKYLLLLNQTSLSRETKKLFINRINYIICNDIIKHIFDYVIYKYPSVGIDIGLSHFVDRNPYKNHRYQKGFLETRDVFSKYINYYNQKNKFPNYHSFLNLNISENSRKHLINKLKINIKKNLLLIYLKDNIANATAKKTDPKTYLEMISFFKKKNFQIVFAGREKFPKIFIDEEIIDYANSSYTSWENDIIIAQESDIIVSFGSGIGSLATTIDKPLLYLGSWHLTLPFNSKKFFFFPTLLKNKKSGSFMKPTDFQKYFFEINQLTFKSKRFIPINPSSKDILMSSKEIYSIFKKKYNLNLRQKKFKRLFLKTPLFYAKSSISKYFLVKYRYLFKK